ncbi:efflux RND transporter permease subunit [Nevskia sp.]|uniref:efflux RND transporter permease subunit n=1 Tax=Nevskia sp. TaxID=1929292 RepID=UPI0025EEC3D2|nr:efflux RND transporter permease subunit [Nevskia sp.]
MKFTDLFIKKPVLATVVSLMILVLGLRSMFGLPVRQYPKTENATVTVTTVYYGANPDVIAGFITTPIEAAVAQAQGIDYLTSSSSSGVSTVTATLQLNYDSNRALSEINTKVQSVLNQLPAEAQQPTLTVQIGEAIAAMYMGFNSTTIPSNKVTDYMVRVVQPKLQTIAGVKQAELIGGRQFALRAWLDPQKLAAVDLTATDVYTALANNNYLSALGTTKGQMVSVDLTAGTDLHSVEEFKELVIKQKGTSLVRLKDVANVTLGAESYDSGTRFDGKQSVFIGIQVAPDANVLTVVKNVRAAFPELVSQLPEGLHGEIVYDSTEYINSSISEVEKTLVEALLIVTVVIFLFLGSFRSVIIPIIAMPLSLIGAFFVMLLLGYSINLLTLLALVLAIGLVVDDAIIVVENVDRHMKMGKKPLEAALVGARELAGPIIAISVVLIAVYVPIGFQGGLTGVLFSEFAFTLAGAVAVSAVVALTLSPMMCAVFLRDDHGSNKFVAMIDHNFERFSAAYRRLLGSLLNGWSAVVVFGFVIMALIAVMMMMPQAGVIAKSELAPAEDQGFLIHIVSGPPNATYQQMATYTDQIYGVMKEFPEYDSSFQIEGAGTINSGIGGFVAKPYEERTRTTGVLSVELQNKSNSIAGASVYWVNPPPLPGGGNGLPIQFVIGTTESFDKLYEVATAVIAKAQATGKFYVLDNGLKIDKPQTTVKVDRDKVASLGLTMRDVGSSLGSLLGGGYVNYFSIEGRSYKVIPQIQTNDRLNASQLDNYYIRAANGTVVPASTVISLKSETVPQSIPHFQQLNSATIGAVFGGTQGEALQILRDIAKTTLPQGYTIDYGGVSRQFVRESGGFLTTMVFALIIIFLTLAAQFESFRDPLVVMMSVPMAIFGAMVFLFLDFATLNVYTQVGLVTLVGLIAKHGILIVQFANEQLALGKSKREAIEIAAETRLRPILMTTAAMVLGVMPLVIASGAGAVGRNHMGLVIATGITIGTIFTLFVVPAMYLWLASAHKQKDAAVGSEAAPMKPQQA